MELEALTSHWDFWAHFATCCWSLRGSSLFDGVRMEVMSSRSFNIHWHFQKHLDKTVPYKRKCCDLQFMQVSLVYLKYKPSKCQNKNIIHSPGSKKSIEDLTSNPNPFGKICHLTSPRKGAGKIATFVFFLPLDQILEFLRNFQLLGMEQDNDAQLDRMDSYQQVDFAKRSHHCLSCPK